MIRFFYEKTHLKTADSVCAHDDATENTRIAFPFYLFKIYAAQIIISAIITVVFTIKFSI